MDYSIQIDGVTRFTGSAEQCQAWLQARRGQRRDWKCLSIVPAIYDVELEDEVDGDEAQWKARVA